MGYRHIRAFLLVANAAAFTLAGAGAATAHSSHHPPCTIDSVTSIWPTVANAGILTGPTPSAPQPVAVSIKLKTTGSGTCAGSLAFYRSSLPPVMHHLWGGSSTLPYAIQSVSGGGNSLVFSGSVPASNNRIDFDVPAGTQSTVVTVFLQMQPGANPAAGFYADHHLSVSVFDRQGASLSLRRSTPFVVTGKVAERCELPPPTPPTLDFTSAISNGRPNAAIVKTVRFTHVTCNAPARLRLVGHSLSATPSTGPRPSFDNFINWRAQATFGAASSVLDTRSAERDTSVQYNVSSGSTTDGTITVDINLVAGNPLIAGSYSGILTVTIDPHL